MRTLLRGIVCFLIFLLLSGYANDEVKQRSQERPNIILVVTDDQDAASLGNMPKLDARLKSRGVSFTNAFVTSSWCAPSRGSILTGRYPGRFGGLATGYQQLHGKLEEKSLAPLLHQAGYRTAFIGKYMNRYGELHPQYIPPGWDEWNGLTIENKYYDYKINENGTVVEYGNSGTDYVTDVLAGKALDFLARNTRERPFFMMVGTVAAHNPHVPAPKYAKSCEEIADISLHFEEDISDKPAWVRDYREANRKLIDGYFGNAEAMTRLMTKSCRTLLSVDDMVESILVRLEQDGRLGNTYLFFVSDNGAGMSRHIPVSPKLSPYDEGIRVPFLVFGPGVPAGRQLPHLASGVDILPTLAEIAGVKPYEGTDGRSLLPILNEAPLPEDKWRKAIYAELVARVGNSWPWKSTPPAYGLMRTKEMKYIEYETGEREYYDLTVDPEEMNNLYSTLSPDARKDLSRQLRELAGGNSSRDGL